MRHGHDAVIEQILADGIHYLFGNPGTVEQGLLDAIGQSSDLEYILTLHEGVAIGIADGYARATKKPTIVQLHTSVGLGNGIGMIYQAMRGHAPLVIIAGEAGIRYDAMDAQMAVDLVAMAKPVTKWATRVIDPDSVLRVLRRAMKIAGTPPMGPVFVSLPMDILDAQNTEKAGPTSYPSTRVTADKEEINKVAALLARAQRPLIIAGDGIAVSGAQQELAQMAELTGAQVWGADWSEVNLDYTHPQFMGLFGHMSGEESRKITTQADVVLVCGTYLFPEVFPALSDVFAPDAQVIHIDLNAYEIAKNFPVDFGIASDPRLTLASLIAVLRETMTPAEREAAASRVRASTQNQQRRLMQAYEQDQLLLHSSQAHVSLFAQELVKHIPDDSIVFDEALTSSPELVRYLQPKHPGQYFLTRGGSLGVGIPGAIGLKLAHPEKTVIGFTGDGGSMYTIQALWTAARYNIAAKFVICNNHSYKLLDLNLQDYWRERSIPDHGTPTFFDLSQPAIDFVRLALSLGIAATRVARPEEITSAIENALSHSGPYLIDLIIA